MIDQVALTPKQRACLAFIWAYWQEHRMAPRLRDLADEFGISKTSIHDRVGILLAKGCVVRERFAARSIRVTARGRAALGLREGQTPLHALRAAWALATEKDRRTFLREARKK